MKNNHSFVIQNTLLHLDILIFDLIMTVRGISSMNVIKKLYHSVFDETKTILKLLRQLLKRYLKKTHIFHTSYFYNNTVKSFYNNFNLKER